MSSDINNYSKLNNTYSWEDICTPLRINKHTLPTVTPKLGKVQFSIRFWQKSHRRFAYAPHVCCVNELVEVGEHEKQTK